MIRWVFGSFVSNKIRILTLAQLGTIAISHLVIASSAELRARDENCIINAALYSKVSANRGSPRHVVLGINAVIRQLIL
jgi:hypothetical protein